MDKKCLIMMTTFNGENYLPMQLDSIISQSYEDWKMIIRDDGSSDNTKQIVENYCRHDNRIKFIRNETQQHGAYLNFHTLINMCKEEDEYSYYLFSDQDDIWDRDKLLVMINSVENKIDHNKPILCYADMRVVNSVGDLLFDSIDAKVGIKYKNPISTFFSHNIYGCNILMNRELFEIVPKIDLNNNYINILSHDNLYAKFAAHYGEVVYIDIPLMSYRRHDSNVTSNHKYEYNISRVWERLTNINRLSEDHALTYNQSIIAIDIMLKSKRNCNGCTNILEIKRAIHSGYFRTFIYALKNRVSWGKPIKTLSRLSIILLGSYKKYLINIE